MPSSDAKGEADTGVPDGATIVEVVRFLESGGMFGALWLDEDLNVRQRLGDLAGFVTLGAPVTDSVPVLLGQELRIRALGTGPEAGLHIPNIAMMTGGGTAPPRLNVSIFRRAGFHGYFVLFGRVLSADVRDLVLEDEIRKRRIVDAELTRINAQLEEFAYVISHDLKAPLRALRYLSGDVADALAQRRPDTRAARQAASGIAEQVQRMAGMLTGLLEYSRIGRQHDAIEEVDTAALIADIVRSTPRPPGLAITPAGAWPTLRTVLVPLDMVLRNLIENAVKHHDRDKGRIDVRASPGDDTVVFEIADDGPGIPKDWQKAVFDPFKRVERADMREGSGIGLALVKRTLETVGGRIDVRSDPTAARGSTFIVTWPRRVLVR
jgi:hypothetical protein